MTTLDGRRPAPGLFREGDRVRSMRTGRTGYVRARRASARLGERYLVDWDGGLEYSLARPIELELVWPVGRGGTSGASRNGERDRNPAAD